MNFVIDIVLIVLILFVVISSSKKGFLSTVLDTFSVVISAVASYMLCTPVAESLYKLFIRDLVRTSFARVLDDVSASLSIHDKVIAMVEGLPAGAVKLAETVGVNVEQFSRTVTSSSAQTNETLINAVTDGIGYDIMITITEFFVFIILFIVAAILVRFISKFFENANKIPLLGKLNALLGGAVGAVKAIVILLVVCTVVFVISASSEDANIINAVASSKIVSFVNSYNPIIDFIN